MLGGRKVATLGGDKFRDDYSLAFDGTADHIDCGDVLDQGTGNFSISVWFKLGSGIAQYDSLITKRESSTLGWQYDIRGTDPWKIGFAYDDNTTTRTNLGDTSLTVGRWYHAVTVVDRTGENKVVQYINGAFDNSNSDTIAGLGTISNSAPLSIGCKKHEGNATWSHFVGNISEIAIYNNALHEGHVKTLYNGREPYNHKEGVAKASLVSWYRMGDTTGRKSFYGSEQISASKNRDFSSASDWTAYGSPTTFTNDGSGKLTIVTAGDGGNEGTQIAIIKLDGTGNAFPITAGRTYRITLKLENTAGKTTPDINVSIGGKHANVIASDGSPWNGTIDTTEQTYYADITATDNTSATSIYQTSSDNDATTTFTIDDVSIKEVGIIKDDSTDSNDGIMLNMAADDFVGDTP